MPQISRGPLRLQPPITGTREVYTCPECQPRPAQLFDMGTRRKVQARKATWLAFGLIALAATSSCALESQQPQDTLSKGNVNNLAVTFQSVFS